MDDITQDKQNFFKHFLTLAPKHCDNCGAKYDEGDFKVINSNNSSIVLHLKCHECQNTYVLNVLNQPNGTLGAQRMPFNSDVNTDIEMDYFAGSEGVSDNNAIDAYRNLDISLTKEEFQKLLFDSIGN